ncbi:MAG: hypothetical protein ACLRWQ_10725 [Flavonifractor plautii]
MKKIEKRRSLYLSGRCALLLAAGLGFCLVNRFLETAAAGRPPPSTATCTTASGQLASGTGAGPGRGRALRTVVDGQPAPGTTMPPSRKATLHAVGDAAGQYRHRGPGRPLPTSSPGTACSPGPTRRPAGNDLYLTIDARYNYIAYEALGRQVGHRGASTTTRRERFCVWSPAPAFDPL